MRKKKHKYIWFNSTLDQSGGGERLSLEVVRCLKEAGYEAHYVVYKYDAKSTFERRYDFLHPISMSERNNKEGGVIDNIVSRLNRLFWLRNTLKQLDAQCVIVSGTWGHVVDVYLVSLFLNVNYVTHVFGSMFAFGPEKETLKFGAVFKRNFKIVRNSMKSYQEVVPEKAPCFGRVAKYFLEIKALLKYSAVRRSKILFVLSDRNRWETKMLYSKDSVVLQGAFPARIFDYRPTRSLKTDLGIYGCKVILSIGRLAPNKRVDLAISAFAKIAQIQNDVQFLIGGYGPEKERLIALSNTLGLANKIHFIGYVSEDILWDYYFSCDAFLHLDLADYDVAPLEALAMGANVIWSNEMDLPSLTKQLPCLWSVAPEPEAIAQATIQAINVGKGYILPEVRRRVLNTYTWESYTERMIQAIESR